MNDRLMIAAMVTNGLLSSGRLSSPTTSRIAADALLMADVLLATAGEQETTKYSPVSIVDQPVSRAEYDRQVARSEAAEAEARKMRDACDAEVERRLERERHLVAARRDLDALRAEVDRLKVAEGEAMLVVESQDASIAALKAELAKRDEPLTDEQAEQAFAIAKADGVGECDTLALGMQGIDAAIRRVRRGE